MPILLNTDGRVIHCPAKLNLTLAVGPPRPDGLHPIASVMVATDFADALYVNPIGDGPSRFAREWDLARFDLEDMARGAMIQPIDWPIEKDLIYQAHALLEKEAGHSLPIECGLDKRIPSGAGLGGGSSDAAGMLIALREVFDLAVSDDRLIELARQLGADVAFLVHALLGRPAAVVSGIGEIVEPLAMLPAFDAVLVFPDGTCPTGEVYSAFDAVQGAGRSTRELDALLEAWRTGDVFPTPMNDLLDAAVGVCPGIGTAVDSLAALGHTAHLTGSGSALFVLAEDPAQAERIAGDAREAGLVACPTRFHPAQTHG